MCQELDAYAQITLVYLLRKQIKLYKHSEITLEMNQHPTKNFVKKYYCASKWAWQCLKKH